MTTATAIAIPNIPQLEKLKTLQVTIVSPDTELLARTYLTDVRAAGKRLDADIKILKAPYQSAIKDIDAVAKPWKDLLAARDQELERAILAYGREVRAAVEAANIKAMAKYEQKVEKAETKAIEQGKPIPVVLPPQLVSAPQKTVEAEGAKQTTIKRKVWRIPGGDHLAFEYTRASSLTKDIPDEFFILDTGRIGKVVRAGGSIPGILVVEEESLSIRA